MIEILWNKIVVAEIPGSTLMSHQSQIDRYATAEHVDVVIPFVGSQISVSGAIEALQDDG